MNLLRKYLSNKINKLMKDNIVIKMIGDKKKLPKDIVKNIGISMEVIIMLSVVLLK